MNTDPTPNALRLLSLADEALAAPEITARVDSPESFERVTAHAQIVKGLASDLVAERKAQTDPLNQALVTIRGHYSEPLARLDDFVSAAKDRLLGYQRDQKRKAEEEQRRLNAERAAREREARERAEEAARAARVAEDVGEVDRAEALAEVAASERTLAEELVREPVRVSGVTAAPRVSGASTSGHWVPRFTREGNPVEFLPARYLKVDTALLAADVKRLGPAANIPGVEAVWEESMALRGRRS